MQTRNAREDSSNSADFSDSQDTTDATDTTDTTDTTDATDPTDSGSALVRPDNDISRRRFLRWGSTAAVVAGIMWAGGSLVSLTGCRSDAGDAFFRHTRTIVDHAGRELEIPTADTIERVYYTSGLAEVYIFSLNPDLMGGISGQFTPQQLQYLPAGINNLPIMGSLSDGGEIDREELMHQDIQIVFSISGVELTAANISDAEALQSATGIPVVLVDGSFDKIGDAYRFVGDILGLDERAEEIATYLEGIYNDVETALEPVTDDERVSLYYAEGAFGLSTEPNASQHAATFAAAKAKNVAQVDVVFDIGMSTVSLESIYNWDPEVIIAWDSEVLGGADELIRTDPKWDNIRAVKDGRVYTMPAIPFAWCDRPPGVNRMIGLQWVANMLYPDLYDIDMVEATKKFYSTLYRVDITDDEALGFLGNSWPPYGKE